MTTTTPRNVGPRPSGSLPANPATWPRWAQITTDDNMVIVTVFHGWGVTDVVRLTGNTATGMADTFAHTVLGAAAATPAPPRLHQIGSSTYETPFRDHEGRAMVAVNENDGNRYVTYAVPAELHHLLPPLDPTTRADVKCDRCGETYLPDVPGDPHDPGDCWYDDRFLGHRAECADCGRVVTDSDMTSIVIWNEYGVCPSCEGERTRWTTPDGTVTLHTPDANPVVLIAGATAAAFGVVGAFD